LEDKQQSDEKRFEDQRQREEAARRAEEEQISQFRRQHPAQIVGVPDLAALSKAVTVLNDFVANADAYRPTTRGLPACCARAASGHATAPPSSVMNWRRFMGCPPQTAGRRLPHRYVKTLLCITAKLIVEWQRWVKSVGFAISETSPLIPHSGAKADMAARRIRARRRLMHCSKLAFSRLPCLRVGGTMVEL
jgi:hypothetical protein